MLTLGLDTTGAYCTAALVKGSETLAESSEEIGRGHAERLAPMVQDVLGKANIKPAEIERIAVCTGPGSFTGLRVAIAFAKGFALPRNIPVVGLSALDVMATQADPDKSRQVVCVMDVRRNQLCWSAYKKDEETHSPKTESVENAVRAITALEPDRIVGDGAHILTGTSSDIIYVSGSVLAKLALVRDPNSYPPDPLYSRPPDAKLPGGVVPDIML